MKDLFQLLKDLQLSPNGYYILYCIDNQCDLDLPVNHATEVTKLELGGFLEDGVMTSKAKKALIQCELKQIRNLDRIKVDLDENFRNNIEVYRKKFPITGGRRTSSKELTERFKWFFKTNPQFTWEMVQKATDQYMQTYADSPYCRTAGYFVKKGFGSTVISDLASWCEALKDQEEEGPKDMGFQKLR